MPAPKREFSLFFSKYIEKLLLTESSDRRSDNSMLFFIVFDEIAPISEMLFARYGSLMSSGSHSYISPLI
ncbi:hypothetical protein D3C87_849070 [compost metagenome]